MSYGKTHVYLGEGKGKTTASFGLALRCYGTGGKVLILQFLKTWPTGEVAAIRKMNDANFQVVRFESEFDLVFDDPTELHFEYLQKDISKAYAYAKDALESGDWNLIVLDEILWAHYFKFLTEGDILTLLQEKHPETELVLTGRYAPNSILERADYITDMRAEKHPFEKGLCARKGIEF